MSKWQIGRKLSDETKKKMSLSGKGRIFSEEHKRKISLANKGKLFSEETRKKISLANKGIGNSNWKGGKSFEIYPSEFNKYLKEQIRQRDNYRCQQCFRCQDELYSKKGKKYKLMIHHIDFNKKNNKPENLISLCRSCHLQTNYNRNDWINYFQERVIKNGHY